MLCAIVNNKTNKTEKVINVESLPKKGERLLILLSDQKTLACYLVDEVRRFFITNPNTALKNEQVVEIETLILCDYLGLGEAAKDNPVVGPYVKG